jgi:hypothetical protein
MKLTSFVRPALRASSAPTTKNRSRSRAGPLKAGRVLRGHPSGLGLDRPEHGGTISQSGRKRAHSSKFKPLVFGYFHAAANIDEKSQIQALDRTQPGLPMTVPSSTLSAANNMVVP